MNWHFALSPTFARRTNLLSSIQPMCHLSRAVLFKDMFVSYVNITQLTEYHTSQSRPLFFVFVYSTYKVDMK